MTPRYAAYGLCALLAALALMWGLGSCRQRQGGQAEVQAAIHQGEANAHVQQAQTIPDHAAKLAQAEKDVAGARAEVERLRRIVAAQRRQGVPDPAGPAAPDPGPVAPDHRDELLVAQDELIQRQAGQIQTLTVALTDEKKRSEQFRLAWESERKASMAQAEATRAWKQAVTTSKWMGRAQGFAAGVALGYVARGQR